MQAPSIFDIFALKGKTVIVTGGTGGLGAAMTVALAEAGANIVSVQLPNDPLGGALKEAVQRLQRNFSVFECDIADSKSIRETFASIWEAGIAPDILLNCAGVNRRGKVEDISDEDINTVLDINLKATYIVSQEFGKRLLELGRPGKIIHVASMVSYVAQTNISIYATSKAGVRQMTKSLSNEWAGKGIQCNCICPGFMKTKLTEPLWTDSEFYKKSIERTPAGRWGLPNDLIGAAILLASRASDYITGESILVDGGVVGR